MLTSRPREDPTLLRGARAPAPADRLTSGALPGAPGVASTRLDDAVALGLQSTVDVLTRFLTDQRADGALLHPAYGTLWGRLAEQVGGKLLRPRLTMAAYLGLGGQDVLAAAHVAAAQELLHTAMVVHDDLLDHDEVRRGRPNLAGSYRAELLAEGVVGQGAEDQVLAAGLLGGDLALVAAFGLVARAPLAPAVRVAVVDLLVRGVGTTVAGELLDVAAGLRAPAQVDTLLVAELKTAAYTCTVPLHAGALAAGADDVVLAALGRFGAALGTAFQLVDDEQGVFGDPARTGKSVLSDLRAGKRTELLRLSYLLADGAGRAVLDTHVGRADLDEHAAQEVRDVMARSGARAQLREIAQRAAATARAVAVDELPAPLAQHLCVVVDELVGTAS
jgi:geranylgeranyl diphosphate synthase, type I